MSNIKDNVESPGSAWLIQIDSHLVNIQESSPNHISLSFDQLSENLTHQALAHQLTKINFNTVVASLKKLHPQILKAKLQKNPDQLYVLTISVNYQFLPQVKEQIIFDKRQIKPEQAEKSQIKNMKNHLRNMKEQISLLTNVQVMEGQIESVQKIFQVFCRIPHEKTLITWTVTIDKPSTNMLKCQLYLFNSATKNRQSSKIIPQEGIYLHHDGKQCVNQMRFVIQQSDKYDNIILVTQGDHKGSYIVSLQKVIET